LRERFKAVRFAQMVDAGREITIFCPLVAEKLDGMPMRGQY